MELLDEGLNLVLAAVLLALVVLYLGDLWQVLDALLHDYIIPALTDVVLVVLDKIVAVVVPLLVSFVH
jgi:hypothetical protein